VAGNTPLQAFLALLPRRRPLKTSVLASQFTIDQQLYRRRCPPRPASAERIAAVFRDDDGNENTVASRIASGILRPTRSFAIVLVIAGFASTSCNGSRSAGRDATESDSADRSISQPEATANSPAETGPRPDRLLDGVITEPVVIYVDASAEELEAARDSVSEEEFAVIADDLMFYRSSANEYLEERRLPVVRVTGRRPIEFRVQGRSARYDFRHVALFDFIVLYQTDREPRVIAPNEVELAAKYFAGTGGR
jgi:hypothetical protein